MGDKDPTITEVLDKLGIDFRDYRTIKRDFMHAAECREIVLWGRDWYKHKCGECAYWWYTDDRGDGDTETRHLANCGCILHGKGFPCDHHTSARPCFLPREVPE